MRYLTVTVRDQNKTIKTVPWPAQNLRLLLLKNKVKLYQGMHKFLNCRGRGKCGTCMVRVVDDPTGLSDRTPIEERMLRVSSPQARLACQATVCGDVTIDCRKTDLDDEADIAREVEEARAAMPKAE